MDHRENGSCQKVVFLTLHKSLFFQKLFYLSWQSDKTKREKKKKHFQTKLALRGLKLVTVITTTSHLVPCLNSCYWCVTSQNKHTYTDNFKGSPPPVTKGPRSDLEVEAAGLKGPAMHNHRHRLSAITSTSTGVVNSPQQCGSCTTVKPECSKCQLWFGQIFTLRLVRQRLYRCGSEKGTHTYTQSQFCISSCCGYWQLKQSRVSANNTFRMNDPGQMLQRGSRLDSAVCNVAPVTAVTFTHRHTHL